ncbi:hypothetical protein Sjap_008637 [Stephania japonica]|uniref:Uncharacterized protein n=1 Tax=Stephania japonica TaxID=461633 RepID=A0AAP0JPW4_9MAGN
MMQDLIGGLPRAIGEVSYWFGIGLEGQHSSWKNRAIIGSVLRALQNALPNLGKMNCHSVQVVAVRAATTFATTTTTTPTTTQTDVALASQDASITATGVKILAEAVTPVETLIMTAIGKGGGLSREEESNRERERGRSREKKRKIEKERDRESEWRRTSGEIRPSSAGGRWWRTREEDESG